MDLPVTFPTVATLVIELIVSVILRVEVPAQPLPHPETTLVVSEAQLFLGPRVALKLSDPFVPKRRAFWALGVAAIRGA
jgi:hypothetical protein